MEIQSGRYTTGLPDGTFNGAGLFESVRNLPTLKDAEERLIAEALKRAGGNQSIAAGILGVTRQALNRRLRRKEE